MREPALALLSFAVCGAGFLLLQRRAMRLAPSAALRNEGEPFPPPAKPHRLSADLFCGIFGMELAALFLLLTARPALSIILCLALGSFLVTLNVVKEETLHEPLVISDAWLLKQIFKYPHLYFPYLPSRKVIMGLTVVTLCMILLLVVEPALPWLRTPPALLSMGLLATAPAGLVILLHRGWFSELADRLLHLFPVSHDAVADAARNGPLTAAFMHLVLSGTLKRHQPDFLDYRHRPKASHWPEHFEKHLHAISQMLVQNRPHVILVQAESFLDVRKVLPEKKQQALAEFLPTWDAMVAEGRTLPTPQAAFGAYTMRTEFTHLTGLDAQTLGPWFYNPYLLAAKHPLWSMARFFNELGYISLCIHPYAGDFFNRNTVIPNLGFQKFITRTELGHLPTFGPYISDLAVADEIIALMDGAIRPIFCFAITMEAHGPWSAGRLTEEEIAAVLPETIRAMFSPSKQVYLCHLKRMDEMFRILNAHQSRNRPHPLVLAYGDHAPALKFS